jgi:putative SOS response-associated peptidase YedK
MCGRYDNSIPRDRIPGLFQVKRLPASNFPPRYNVAPTQEIPIVRLGRDGEREVVMARWGLVPFWMKEKPKKAFINARAETVHSAPMFREAFARRRCLVPATGFYEWQKRAKAKQPYRIRRRDLEPFAFAGLWEFARIAGEEILSAAIIVTDANALVAQLHDRMPVILSPESYEEWLDPESDSENLRRLLRPADPDLLEAYPVSRSVNSPDNDWEVCVEPLAGDD